MSIMDELYNETSERLFLMNRFMGRVKGLLSFPMLRNDAQVIDELKKIVEECEVEYQKMWDKQLEMCKDRMKPGSDISDCCGKPITFEKDSSPVCTKCDQDCNAVGGYDKE
jgi:hypothetical protein